MTASVKFTEVTENLTIFRGIHLQVFQKITVARKVTCIRSVTKKMYVKRFIDYFRDTLLKFSEKPY